MFDVVVIGGGPGGVRAAKVLGRRGKKVALVSNDLGGECLNYGCIPTKTYLWTAELLERLQSASTFGIDVASAKINWKQMQARKVEVVTKLKKNMHFSLEREHVEIIEGTGTFEDGHKIKVKTTTEEKIIEGSSIILATGSEAIFLKGFEKSDRMLSNKEILDLPEIPKTLLIIGGGVVGVEFASLFASLGTQVTIAERGEALILHEDKDVRGELERIFIRNKITILKNTELTPTDPRVTQAEKVLIAVGRKPAIASLCLEKAGITAEPNGVTTNEFYQTNIPHIFAIGDLAGKALLAYTAEREGEIAAQKILGEASTPLDYGSVPDTIFSRPEVASIGMTEDAAKNKGISYVTGASAFSANSRALIHNSRDGFVKIIAEKESKKILGIHIIGEYASELIAQAAHALTAKMTLSQFSQTIYSHPIISETLKEACEQALAR